uniref:Tubulin alpha-6 chain n=1 Tax=Aegilops tauschii subsp. strangulata TaxID=200361 RepID=A0A453HYZ7_AEGTS
MSMELAVIHLARPALTPSPSLRPRGRRMLRLRVRCRIDGDEGGGARGSEEDEPESLFAKELRKRGVGAAAAEFERAASGADGQRERSVALNSEGLEGLVPRAKLLLSLGGTFFLAFGPLIIVTVSLFAGLYLYFGQSFVHDGSKKPVAPPPYIDPYELLEDDRISRPSLD